MYTGVIYIIVSGNGIDSLNLATIYVSLYCHKIDMSSDYSNSIFFLMKFSKNEEKQSI